MTKEELLATLTYEELYAELKKRKEAHKKQIAEERANAKRCRNCVHFCTVNYRGVPIDKSKVSRIDAHCCPFKPNKNGKRYLALMGYEKACENFDREAV